VTVVTVAGTGTDVGKTYVTAAVADCLRARGCDVIARKPAQSFAPGDDAGERTDAHVLARATGQAPVDVSPPARWLPTPLAPPIAADALGLPPFTIAELATESLDGIDANANTPALLFVETAGGVRSPVASDGDCLALVTELAPEWVVLVADAGLGTINVVRLSVDALRKQRVVVYLNRYDPALDVHVRNAQWLTTREGLAVLTDVEALATFLEPLAR